jgi:hypothetical protein
MKFSLELAHYYVHRVVDDAHARARRRLLTAAR